MTKVALKVGGRIFEHWTGVQASRGIEQLSGTFELLVTTDRDAAKPLPIRPGDACQALFGGEPAFTGYVDAVQVSTSATQHTISVMGRDKTGDLVDCSAIYKSGQWFDRKIEQIARDLVAPYKLQVIVETDTGAPFETFSIQEGESVWECLERAARMRALLLITDPRGNLVITRAGRRRVSVELVEGENILEAAASWDWRERFSSYTVKSQGRLTDDGIDEDAVHGAAHVTDPVINRHRPLIVLAEHQGQTATLTDRANWEKSVRMGRGNRGEIAVHGWHHKDGLWIPNTLVHVYSPLLALDAEMLVVRCIYIQDARGTRTQLTIARPEAFERVEGVGMTRLSNKLHTKRKRESERKRHRNHDWSLY